VGRGYFERSVSRLGRLLGLLLLSLCPATASLDNLLQFTRIQRRVVCSDTILVGNDVGLRRFVSFCASGGKLNNVVSRCFIQSLGDSRSVCLCGKKRTR